MKYNGILFFENQFYDSGGISSKRHEYYQYIEGLMVSKVAIFMLE
jgi:hypothetical protein